MSLIAGSALVTGGGSGLGRAIALALAAGGAPVAVVDLSPEGGAETVALIRDKGGRAAFVQADVSRWPDVDRAVAAGVRELGPLGIMVNAAGILDGYQPIEEMAPTVFERLIAINLTGTFFGCKRALAEMLPRHAGRVINMASVAGLIGGGGGPAYVASKHGVVGLTRQIAVGCAGRGVTVNANSTRILGPDAPPMRGVGGDEAAVRAVVPAGRRGTVEEVAAAACYLAGDGAAYVTGHTLVIDGGWTAQ
jgi:NAD(P)-dependent dehydrogenase (short-subunit alcohol dehydrogenase family)